MQQFVSRQQRAADVDHQLDQVSPNHRGDAAFERINQSKHAHDYDRPQPEIRQARQAGAEYGAQDERRREHPHAFGQSAHQQKKGRGEVFSLHAEPVLEQFVGSQQIAAKICRDEK